MNASMMQRPRNHESLSEDAPVITAREHGSLADQLYTVGDLNGAIKQHHLAADAYMECITFTQNRGLVKTLNQLHADHKKAAKDLQRRLDEGVDRGRLGGPSRQTSASSSTSSRATGTQSPLRRDVYRRYMEPPTFSRQREDRPQDDDNLSVSVTPIQSASTSPAASRIFQDSQTTEKNIDESYMVLQGNAKPDPSDSFAVFWNALEGMLDKISQPVAFATAPLNYVSSRRTSKSSDEEYRDARSSPSISSRSLPASKNSPKKHRDEDDDSDSDSSFCMIPSSAPPSAPVGLGSTAQYPPLLFQSGNLPTVSSLQADLRMQEENKQLKDEVSELKARLNAAEEIVRAKADQEQALRNSVLLVRREARRVMASSTSLPRGPPPPSASPHIPQVLQGSPMLNSPYGPNPTVTLSRPASPSNPITNVNPNANIVVPILDPTLDMQSIKRIKELEDQLSILKADNEHQKAQIARYRERWQKLKESAKRKKKENASVSSAPPEKIPEEDEGAASDGEKPPTAEEVVYR